jgi:hypothetical protein
MRLVIANCIMWPGSFWNFEITFNFKPYNIAYARLSILFQPTRACNWFDFRPALIYLQSNWCFSGFWYKNKFLSVPVQIYLLDLQMPSVIKLSILQFRINWASFDMHSFVFCLCNLRGFLFSSLLLQLTMNDFSVHRIIGRGGFGEVYGCRKADTGKM